MPQPDFRSMIAAAPDDLRREAEQEARTDATGGALADKQAGVRTAYKALHDAAMAEAVQSDLPSGALTHASLLLAARIAGAHLAADKIDSFFDLGRRIAADLAKLPPHAREAAFRRMTGPWIEARP